MSVTKPRYISQTIIYMYIYIGNLIRNITGSHNSQHFDTKFDFIRLMVHIHWASDARNQWSHSRLHNFPGNKLYGMHKNKILLYYIVIVYVRNDHTMVKNTLYLCIPYSLLPGKLWSLAWDHWSRASDAQCMCTISVQEHFRLIVHAGKSFLYLVEPKQTWIIITIFRSIGNKQKPV